MLLAPTAHRRTSRLRRKLHQPEAGVLQPSDKKSQRATAGRMLAIVAVAAALWRNVAGHRRSLARVLWSWSIRSEDPFTLSPHHSFPHRAHSSTPRRRPSKLRSANSALCRPPPDPPPSPPPPGSTSCAAPPPPTPGCSSDGRPSASPQPPANPSARWRRQRHCPQPHGSS
jgi:hypothetical protein